VAGDEGDGEVGAEHQAVFELRDGEGEERRDEEEIPRERTGHTGGEHGPAADAQAERDDREKVDQADGEIARMRNDEPAGEGECGEDGGDVDVFASG
jgi:hypothetical protein